METGTANDKNQLYPVFLKLEQLRILLVGGGNVAMEKLTSLLLNSPKARITLVAPFVRNEVKDFLANYPACQIVERPFEAGDIQDKELIFLTTDNPQLHEDIKIMASGKGILVNVADTPDLCDFYLGSIVQKGSLKIAISTNGKSPTLARRLKEFFNEVLPDEIETAVTNLNTIRNNIHSGFKERVKQLNELTASLIRY